jgi:type IV pilus assembly protein PilC
MAEFVCKVGTSGGEILQKVFVAESERALRDLMEQQGYYIFAIQRKLEAKSLLKSLFHFKRKKVTDKQFIVFNQEFAALVHSGLPMLRCLELLTGRADNPDFGAILEDVRRQVQSGALLSDAFASHPDVFPRIYTASILAGEKSGELEQVIRRYLTYAKIITTIRTKVTSSLIYPLLLLCLSLSVIGILVGYVIPKFSDFYTGFAGQLPLITQILVTVSLFVRNNFIWMLPILIIGAILLKISVKASPKAEEAVDRLKLRLPLFGAIWTKFSISQLTRTLHTLLAGGITLVNAIDVAAGAVGSRLISQRLAQVSQGVKEGDTLWASLQKTSFMTPMAVEMVKVGEETGSLEEMLKNISDFYDEEIDTSITNLLSIVEPVMLIAMGIVIAAILLAMYYPLFTLITTVN